MIQDTTHGTSWNVSRMAVTTAIVLPPLLRNRKNRRQACIKRVFHQKASRTVSKAETFRIFPQLNRAKFPFPSLPTTKLPPFAIVQRPQFTYIRWGIWLSFIKPSANSYDYAQFRSQIFLANRSSISPIPPASSFRHHIPLTYFQTMFRRLFSQLDENLDERRVFINFRSLRIIRIEQLECSLCV